MVPRASFVAGSPRGYISQESREKAVQPPVMAAELEEEVTALVIAT